MMIRFGIRMKRLFLTACLITVSAMTAWASPGTYRETFDQSRPVEKALGGILHSGQDGAWFGEIEGGRYVLSNKSETGAIRYYYLTGRPDTPEAPLENRAASVEVEVLSQTASDPNLISGAGLLYGFDPQKRSYSALILLSDGSYGFFVRDEEGFKMRLGGTHTALRPGRPNRLAVAPEAGKGLALSINGERIATFGSSIPRECGIGLIAVGIGRFAFDDFEIGSAPAGEPLARGGGVIGTQPGSVPVTQAGSAPPKPSRKLSGEYTVTGEPGGSGRILMRRASASSARALLDLSLNDMTGYFDERPRITGAFVDVGDRSARAAFRGSYEGKPLAGLIVADVHGGGSHIAVLYDEPGILPSSLDRLAASADRMLPAPAQPQPQWHTVQLPDGGSMRLPEGWRVTASNKGMVDVAGPEGAGAAFGINFPVNIPGSLPPQLQAHVMVAPYIEPAAAVVGLASELARLYSPPGVTPPGPPRIIEQLPVQMPEFPQGRGAFIHFESRANNVDGHAPYRTLALVITAPTGPMTWMYYFSQIQAPEPVFRRMLPTMMEIWKNWKVSDRVLRDRLDAALGNMREIGEMARASSQAREKAMDKVHADWVEYIQGTRYERDATTGEMRIQSLHDISEIVRKKNELEGFERYQEIPLRELNQ